MQRSMLKLDQSIVKDFGGKSGPTQEGVRALVESIRSSGDEGVLRSLQRWTDLFRKTCGQDWPRPTSRLDRLARHYGVSYDAAQPQVVLFALQTWYVLLIKLLVGQAIAKARSR